MREPAFWYRHASWKSHLLKPLASLYGAVAARRLKRKGLNAGIPVFCLGNYHGGGAGKTPAVLALVEILRELGEKPIVLSRGYRGRLRGPVKVDASRHDAGDIGDEPLMLAPYVTVVVSRDRADGVALVKSLAASVIVMDDGFQSPALVKDASLIVIDSVRGVGNAQVMPSGPLRAPLAAQIERTDALIVIGDGGAADGVAATVAGRGKPVLRAGFRPDESSLVALRGKRALAFAGIGDPARFFATLRHVGVDVASTRTFPDHHPFTPDEAASLVAEAQRGGLTLVTTEKDIARLGGASGLPEWARAIVPFKVRLEFDDAVALRKFVGERLFKARARA